MEISNSSPDTCFNPNNMIDSSALAIKVRKPYTITKQRERWTDQEHAKFLEALKLYGRAWRQIEEHIGTKSAIQIRSHAQKFFTKVVRESDEVKSIVIPPPRPKKKPSKPYPRKLGNLPKLKLTEKPEWPVIPKLPIYNQDRDNFSPTSIISAIESNTSGSSSVSASHVETLSNEKENDVQSATTSVDNQDNSLALHSSDMELDLASSSEAPATSLKLFGKMLTIADSQKLLSCNISNSYSAPTFYLSPSDRDNIANVPWLCGVSENTPQSSPREECLNDDQNDDSFTDSNSIEINNNVGAQDDDIVFDEVPKFKLNHSGRSAFRIFETISKSNAKGFVPYRR